MGHKCLVPQPSPLAMLAIFHAFATGMNIRDIAARTGHSKSSIIRWWQAWGQDHAIYRRLIESRGELMAPYTFEGFFGHFDRKPEIRHVKKSTADSALLELIRRDKEERLATSETPNF